MRILATALVVLTACSAENDSYTVKQKPGGVPIAEAGSGGTFSSDQPIALDGSSSTDPDGDWLLFNWSFERVPEGSALLGNTDVFRNNGTRSSQTRFFADMAGTYIVNLVVTDSTGLSSAPDAVILTVEQGQLPIADAGADVSIFEGETTTLSGLGSADPLGRSLTYQWSVATKPSDSTAARFSSQTDVSPVFTPDVSGSYLLSLVVNNGLNNSEPDSVVVNVETVNPLAPTAIAGEDITGVEDCVSLSLDGSASTDPNGDSLEYLWALQSKPADSRATDASFSDTTAAQPTFYPDVAGSYVLSLAVYDGITWSIPDSIALTVDERSTNSPPDLNAGSSMLLDAGTADCQLTGYNYNCAQCAPVVTTIGSEASVSDPDGDPISYEWVLLNGEATISNPNAAETEVSFPAVAPEAANECSETVYELELTAEDCPGQVDTDTISVTISCCGVEAASR